MRVNVDPPHANPPTNLTAADLTVTINGRAIAPSTDTGMMWTQKYKDVFAGEYLAWSPPVAMLVRGANVIGFSLTQEARARGVSGVRIQHVDLQLTVAPTPAPNNEKKVNFTKREK